MIEYDTKDLGSLPRTVESRQSFEFKILLKNNQRNISEVMTMKVADVTTGAERTITLSINSEVTSLTPNHDQYLLKPLTIRAGDGKMILVTGKSGRVSAMLYSPMGKVIATLCSNMQMNRKTTFTAKTADYSLSEGMYILNGSIRDSEGETVIQDKIYIHK